MRYLLTAGLCSIMLASPPVPRHADPLTIVEASGKKLPLSSYKGKVVLLQFLLTTCQHCQQAAQLYAKLQKEWTVFLNLAPTLRSVRDAHQ